MEDFSKAFADNRYVDAAKLLEQVRASANASDLILETVAPPEGFSYTLNS
jgi:hypothetical protein